MDISYIVVGIIAVSSAVLINGLPYVIANRRKKKKWVEIERNIQNIEHSLAQKGFVISRKIGDYNWKLEANTVFLYIDDVNKHWFVTSPTKPEIGKIRKFDDLISYDFFDEDTIDMSAKMGQGALGLMGAIAGGVLGGGFGALVGGAGMAKAGKAVEGKGSSAGYGFMINSRDCNANNPVLVFDFCALKNDKSFTGKNITLTVERNSKRFKMDFAACQEMAAVFDYIIKSSV